MLDYEVGRCQLMEGAVTVADRSYTRGDALNITGITDNVTAANNQTFGYTAANRLSAATGPYGSLAWGYDGVGNRTSETAAGVTDTYVYPGTSNRIQSITRGASTVRQMTYDGAGNLATDNRLGVAYSYTYDKRNRMSGATVGALPFAYGYNGLEQLVTRAQTGGPMMFTAHFVHDIFGNVIAGLSQSFGYTAANRLSAASGPYCNLS